MQERRKKALFRPNNHRRHLPMANAMSPKHAMTWGLTRRSMSGT